MRKIPDDILYQIFLQVVIADFYHPCPEAISGRKRGTGKAVSPWTLAVVCSRARQICLESSQLWSYITFAHRRCDKPYSSSLVLRTYTQLERSRSSPLYIDASLRFCKCECVFSALRIVAAQCHRWRVLKFANDHVKPDHFQTRYLQDRPCSQLQTIDWWCRDGSGENRAENQLPFTDRNHPENLHSATIHRLTRFSPAFLWYKITNLCLVHCRLPLDDLLTVLTQCTELVHYAAHNMFITEDAEEGEDEYELESITLGQLISLEFLDEKATGNPGVNQALRKTLPYIHAPGLRRVKCSPLDQASDDALSDFAERSGDSITELDISTTGPGPAFDWESRQLLATLSDLESLTVRETLTGSGGGRPAKHEHPTDRDDILCMLLQFSKDSQLHDYTILSTLKHLTLEYHFVFDPALLVQVVESRMDPAGVCVALQSLKVVFNQGFGELATSFCRAVLEDRLGSLEGFKLCLER